MTDMTDIKQLEYEVADIVAKMHQLTNQLHQKLDAIRAYKPRKPEPVKTKTTIPIVSEKPRYIRFNELVSITGVSRTTIWRWEREGILPKHHKIGPNSVAWLSTDIDNWMEKQ